MNKEEKQIDLISCKRRYQGVGFIKSRKSEFAIMDMAEEMIKTACANGYQYPVQTVMVRTGYFFVGESATKP